MTTGEDPGVHIMSVAVRTATLLRFPTACATVPFPSARARRTSTSVRTWTVQASAWIIPPHPVVARENVPAGMLRRLAMALGLGAMLLASTGAAGWVFVAAEQATRSSLAAYVAALGARS